jgi:FKBP-type peptidyl-prolyl cis-trans isomerase SlyD
MEVSENKVVSIHYKGTLKEDGSVFDSSEGREPLLFLFGKGMIIPGLEEGMVGLKVGDKKSIEVGFEKAYGPKMEEAKQDVPKDQLPKEAELKVGLQLMAQGPQGAMPVTIAAINDTTVTVDFNHPLAGKDLIFDIEVIDVREPTKEELEHGHAHGAGGVTHDSDVEGADAATEEPKKEEASLEDSLDESKEDKKSE